MHAAIGQLIKQIVARFAPARRLTVDYLSAAVLRRGLMTLSRWRREAIKEKEMLHIPAIYKRINTASQYGRYL